MSHFCLIRTWILTTVYTSPLGNIKTVGRRRPFSPDYPDRLGHHIMASLLPWTSVVQPFLMMLNNSVETPILLAQNSTLSNATQNATGDATPLTIPTDFSSLITFIYSFSALGDYFKLIVLGGAFETLRRLYSASYTSLVDRFFITATFESEDLSYGTRRFPLH